MLRKIRIILAVIVLVAITMLFLDFTGTVAQMAGWLVRVQFVPALLAHSVIVVLSLVVLSLIFGRVYCSVLCPLGIMQDLISWIHGKINKKRKFSFSKARTFTRLSFLILFIILLFLSANIAGLLDPYSAYGRIVSALLRPLYIGFNNILANVQGENSYLFYNVDFYMSISITIIAMITVGLVGYLAWRGGRSYCNTVCPVGTVLGYLSKYSWLKPVIGTSKCNGCGSCARRCKASCIDYKEHNIDYSRCVACMDCINNCRQGAISYRHINSTNATKRGVDDGRRSFIVSSALIAGSTIISAQEKKVDGGLAKIINKEKPKRQVEIVPPGAISLRHLSDHCTACQLCISNCPNNVLRPSNSIETFMQPVVSYERGYCRPECTRCSEVCPDGAILKIDKAEKSAIQIGIAVWVKERCLPATQGVRCDNCARHCPVGAITMVAIDENSRHAIKIPAIDTERCIGCGACENLCPSRPLSAIYVEGNDIHRNV